MQNVGDPSLISGSRPIQAKLEESFAGSRGFGLVLAILCDLMVASLRPPSQRSERVKMVRNVKHKFFGNGTVPEGTPRVPQPARKKAHQPISGEGESTDLCFIAPRAKRSGRISPTPVE
jgi:hypothetical protein